MNNRTVMISVAWIAGLIVLILVFQMSEKRLPNSDETNSHSSMQVDAVGNAPSRLEEQQTPSAHPSMPQQRYEMVAAEVTFDSIAEAKIKEREIFRLYGRGSNAKIVDMQGNTILHANPKIGIFGCKVSPNQKQILVYFGDAEYEILRTIGGDKVVLPTQPPGETKLAFGSWNWIDDDTLLGISAETLPFGNEQPGEEPNIERSVLFVYSITTRKLTEVVLPQKLRSKTFSVSAVDSTGKVQLRPEGGLSSLKDMTYGWFEIRLRKR